MDVGQLDTTKQFANADLQLPESLPKLNGSWFMLVYPIELEASITTKGGLTLLLPDDAAAANEALLTAGIVVKQGALCYKHSKYKDPITGDYLPWCEVGDYVVYSRTAFGHSVVHNGRKFFVLPDDGILYTVKSPKDIDPKFQYNEESFQKLKQEVLNIPKDPKITL